MLRRPRDLAGMILAGATSGVVYWTSWSMCFAFVLPLLAAFATVRERHLLLLLDVGSSGLATVSSTLVVAACARINGVRYRRTLLMAAVGWGLAGVAPGRAVPSVHAVPPMSLVFQVPVVLAIMAVGIAAHPRAAKNAIVRRIRGV